MRGRWLLAMLGVVLILAGGLLAHFTQTAGGIRIEDVRFKGTKGNTVSALVLSFKVQAAVKPGDYVNQVKLTTSTAAEIDRGDGVGLVVDGMIRDWPRVREIGLPLWTRGATPNYASQGSLFPWAYNVPIACSRVLP